MPGWVWIIVIIAIAIAAYVIFKAISDSEEIEEPAGDVNPTESTSPLEESSWREIESTIGVVFAAPRPSGDRAA